MRGLLDSTPDNYNATILACMLVGQVRGGEFIVDTLHDLRKLYFMGVACCDPRKPDFYMFCPY